MDLRVTFGWHLDGPSFPEIADLGAIAVGPIGFLNQLALRLGLIGPLPPRSVRIGNYLSLLKQHDNGQKFYSRSFQVDAWGTARALLHLRDELIGAGWEPGLSEGGGSRIDTLAEIERVRPTRSDSIADLCFAVARALESSDDVSIAELTLCDRLELLPPIWQRIIRALSAKGVRVHQLAEPSDLEVRTTANTGNGITVQPGTASGETGQKDASDTVYNAECNTTDRKRLAQSVVARRKQSNSAGPPPDCGLTGDGSLLLIEGDDEVQCADLLADWLGNYHQSGGGEVVIIRGAPTTFLDCMLQKRDLPVLGRTSTACWRGFLQLLQLALEMSWKPTNPALIAEFLMLPNGPVPRFAATCFIEALRAQPGIGGSAWLEAWQKALERKRAFLQKDEVISDEAKEEALRTAEEEWRSWLEPPTFDAADGMTVAQLTAICGRVRNHALKLFNVHNENVYAEAAANAETLSSSVLASGSETVSRAQLDRIMESVIAESPASSAADCAPWALVDHPGQIYGPAETVIWWGFTSEIRTPPSNPWTEEELQFLCQRGVHMDTPSNAVAREAESWCRPATEENGQIIFVKPRTIAGRQVAAHPFYHEIASFIEVAPPAVRGKIVRQAHHIYQQPCTEVGTRQLVRKMCEPVALPGARAVWKIKPESVGERAESPSSLERMLGCPLSWLLRYRTFIKASNLLNRTDGEQLSGNLAHAVFASVFSHNHTASPEQMGAFAEEAFDDLCPKVAAPLLMPGKSLERQRLKKAVRDGAAHLAEMIAQAGFTSVICETEKHGMLDAIELRGRPDMVLKHSAGDDFVLDVKWSRRTTRRRQELADGTAIQLAIYSWLCNLDSKRRTAGGYYMLSQKQLLSSAPGPFPPHAHITGPPLEKTFQDVLGTYEQHLTHLRDGTVFAAGVEEIPKLGMEVERVVEEEEEVLPVQIPGITLVLEPPCKICDYGRICGKRGVEQ